MNWEIIQYIVNRPSAFFALIAVMSFMVIAFIMQEVYQVARVNGFTAGANERGSHKGQVPNLGGLAVYFAVVLSITGFLVFFKGLFETALIGRMFLGATILLFVGLYDDLHDIPPRKKFLYQVFVAMVTLVLLGKYGIDFYGLFGVGLLGATASFFFSTFLIVSLINAFNFIDGIDGLCTGLAIITLGFFTLLGFLTKDLSLLLVNGALIGALSLAFYKNVYSRRKMFLGDSGSLLIGFVISVEVILVLSGRFASIDFLSNTAPVVLMALLSFPLVDSLRVIFLRLARGVSPFSADRRHIHHTLLDLGLSHKKATLAILLYTVFIVVLAILLRKLNIHISFIVLFVVSFAVLNVPVFLLRYRNSRVKQSQLQR